MREGERARNAGKGEEGRRKQAVPTPEERARRGGGQVRSERNSAKGTEPVEQPRNKFVYLNRDL